MKIEIAHMPEVLTTYIYNEMLPKMAGLQKFTTAAVGFALANRASALIQDASILSTLKMLGVLDDTGMIDMAFVREMLLDAMQKSGGSINELGYIFDADDIEAMYTISKQIKGVA